jgi:hypothetical protein
MKLARDLTEQNAMQAFLRHTNTMTLKQKMDLKYYNFLNKLNCLTHLRKIIQANVNKFMTVKLDLILAEIKPSFQPIFTI